MLPLVEGSLSAFRQSTFVSRTMLVGAFQKTILLMPIFEKQTPPPPLKPQKAICQYSYPMLYGGG